MPILETRGNACAMAFGFLTGEPPEAPGEYSFPNGFQGASYQPSGWSNVTVTLNAPGGKAGSNPYSNPSGSTVERTGTPVSDLYISMPSHKAQPNSNGGSGGSGGNISGGPAVYKGYDGGGAAVAYWNSAADVLVGAGGGGSSFETSQERRRGKYEGDPSTQGNAPNSGSGNNGGNGSSGSCYYGGGGGGGGYSTGGNGGTINAGGKAGGNGAVASPTGTGSYNYTSVTVGNNNGFTYDAKISWG